MENEVITFVVDVCFKSFFSIFDFKLNVKVRSRLLSVGSILYCNLIWIDEMHIIAESGIVQ